MKGSVQKNPAVISSPMGFEAGLLDIGTNTPKQSQ